ncbi:MAG: RdgB/HAM1 family non-canonical purine NTP pyrophosphatase [Eubacteriales bacterium]|nr:RdgB/HAM1 family non-canonical purine NTP pyrophosphatase [Eubacteriales bacterium]
MSVMILATENEGKIGEFLDLARHSGFELVSMRAAGFTGTIVEDGQTYEANALIKARAVHRQLGGFVLADDSGLSVDVLDGAPGIYSARFAGENATYQDKIAQLHAWLAPYPPETWQASFVCAIAIIQPDGREEVVRGECRGIIAQQAAGSNGFGYDPIFFLPDYGQTMAQIDPALKNQISHRARALALAALVLPHGLTGPDQVVRT